MGIFKELAKTGLQYLSREDADTNAISNNSITPSQKNYYQEWIEWTDNDNFLAFANDVNGLVLFRENAYACIKKIAMNVAKGQPFLYKEFKKKTNEIHDHPFLRVLRNGNIYGQSFQDIIVMTVYNLYLNKKAYWHIVKTKTAFGDILNEIRVLPSRFVQPVYNKENTLIEYYEYNQNKRVRFDKEEILEFCNHNPNSNTEGLAPIDRFIATLNVEKEMQQYANELFKNGGNIDGFLSTDQALNDEQRKQLAESWRAKYTGAGNRHKTAVMDKGLTYEQMSTTPRELDFAQSEKNVRDKIFIFFEVPPPVMGVVENVNYSNGDNAQKSFIENMIEPYAKIMIESKINMYFRKMYGDKFKFVLEYDFETDPALQLRKLEFYLKFIKPEVIAEMEGFGVEDVKEVVDLTPTPETTTEDTKEPAKQK